MFHRSTLIIYERLKYDALGLEVTMMIGRSKETRLALLKELNRRVMEAQT
jgi:hypothetical protein